MDELLVLASLAVVGNWVSLMLSACMFFLLSSKNKVGGNGNNSSTTGNQDHKEDDGIALASAEDGRRRSRMSLKYERRQLSWSKRFRRCCHLCFWDQSGSSNIQSSFDELGTLITILLSSQSKFEQHQKLKASDIVTGYV